MKVNYTTKFKKRLFENDPDNPNGIRIPEPLKEECCDKYSQGFCPIHCENTVNINPLKNQKYGWYEIIVIAIGAILMIAYMLFIIFYLHATTG